MVTAAIRITVCFAAAEMYYDQGNDEVGCICYLEGLLTLQREHTDISPLEYLRLCISEEHILRKYVVPLCL